MSLSEMQLLNQSWYFPPCDFTRFKLSPPPFLLSFVSLLSSISDSIRIDGPLISPRLANSVTCDVSPTPFFLARIPNLFLEVKDVFVSSSCVVCKFCYAFPLSHFLPPSFLDFISHPFSTPPSYSSLLFVFQVLGYQPYDLLLPHQRSTIILIHLETLMCFLDLRSLKCFFTVTWHLPLSLPSPIHLF